MKKLNSLYISMLALFIAIAGATNSFINQSNTEEAINMANTVNPILHELVAEKCGFETPHLGGFVISKREQVGNDSSGCIDGKKGNAYYARCVSWGEMDGVFRMVTPVRDIPLNSYSCVDENQLNFPIHNKAIASADIGQEVLFKGL